jgi:hypothetical protein
MSTRDFLGVESGRRVRLTTICEATVYKMWEPRRLLQRQLYIFFHITVVGRESQREARYPDELVDCLSAAIRTPTSNKKSNTRELDVTNNSSTRIV